MDSQTKHRILGILVVVGIVIILLPLFQGSKEIPTETAMTKAPPFPEPTVQTAANMPEQTAIIPIPQPTPVLHNDSPQQVAYHDAPPLDDTISTTRPSVIKTKEPAIAFHEPAHEDQTKDIKQSSAVNRSDSEPQRIISGNQLYDGDFSDSNVVKHVAVKKRKAIKSLAKAAKVSKTTIAMKTTKACKTTIVPSIDNNGLYKVNSAVWIIQLGSYKHKASALQLVNQLRANGYRAFIQQMSTAMGEDTEVYVGPENKQSSAQDVAKQIENQMHLRGIVISYKPLTL